MAKKNISNIRFVGYNLLAAVVIALVIVTAVVASLKAYTQHGIEEEIPSLIGLTPDEAEYLLEKQDLQLAIYDSVYNKKAELGTIVEQTPMAGGHCKHGRSIYVVVNAKNRKQIAVPDIRDMSSRQAQSILTTLGIKVADLSYEPSEYKDLVLDIRQGETSIAPGTRLTEGSEVTLVIGYGKGVERTPAPDLKGRTLQEARVALLGQYLVLGAYTYDEEPTEENREQFVVFRQSIAPGEMIQEGSAVSVELTLDIQKAVYTDNTDEEDFF